jgi:hypothetical protein
MRVLMRTLTSVLMRTLTRVLMRVLAGGAGRGTLVGRLEFRVARPRKPPYGLGFLHSTRRGGGATDTAAT